MQYVVMSASHFVIMNLTELNAFLTVPFFNSFTTDSGVMSKRTSYVLYLSD